MTFDAIILAGASSVRLDGRDKALVCVRGKSLLERVVAAAFKARQILVVGPRRDLHLSVRWVDEQRRGAGPMTALATGLRLVESEIVVVLAVDHPLLTEDDVARLVTSVERDGAVGLDGDGRRQPLLAAYRTSALIEAVHGLSAVENAAMRDLEGVLDVTAVELGEAATDCDTWSDIESVRLHRGR